MKRRLIVINSNYPSPTNLYGDVFVHSRVRHYMQHFDIQVLGCNPTLPAIEQFVYEGVNVLNINSKEAFAAYVKQSDADAICIHFISGWMVNDFLKDIKVPVYIWIHGHEALGWYRRLFNLKLKDVLSFSRYILSNTRQMFRMHQLANISNDKGNIHFIFVSKWMKKITETDTFSNIRYFSLVPNPIDSKQFTYIKKGPEYRKKILLIRSFDSKKYANDVATDAIMHLSTRPFFKDLQFAIYGKGQYFKPLTDKLKQFDNVKVVNEFVENKNIPGIHREYGVFLCPTRQDAQGVSMCEAMSSGLVPVTSNNTAIPEFITDGYNGLLSNSALEMADCLERLYRNEALFEHISANAASSIRTMAGHEVVIANEIALMNSGIARSGN